MKIAVLGTGLVGETLASKLVELGHEVRMGSRNATNEKGVAWASRAGERASFGTFEDAAKHGELIVVATSGAGTMDALNLAKRENLAGKVVIDVTNPLDFSRGMPPSLFVCNTDSLGEQIQRAFPEAKVVKTLNTVFAGVMVNPRAIDGAHTVFLSGDDDDAKRRAQAILESFGWRASDILDLGDITTARGPEAYLLLWLRLWGATGNGVINVRVVAGKKT